MKSTLTIFFVILFSAFGYSQKSAPNWEISASAFGGYLMVHHPGLTYIRNGHIKGFDINLGRRADGSKDWHHAFNFPSSGLTFSAADLASPHLGNEYSLRWFIDLPLVKKRWLGLKMDLGAAYIEEPFETFDNIHNSAIGSHLNAALELFIYGKIQIGNNIDLKPGIGIQHYSNGAYQMPNSGVNIALIKATVVYHKYTKDIERKTLDFEKSKLKYYVGSSFGLKEITPIGGDKYGVVNIYGQVAKRVTPKSSFGGEIGLNYNESLSHRQDEIETGSGVAADNYRIYAAAQYQLHFDPFGIKFQAGTYIAPKFTEDGALFFRYHVYYDYKHFQFFLGLKSHFAKADNAEVGLNYRLN